MMRNPAQTVGNLIDHAGLCYLGSVDEAGFPQTRAMLPPRERKGICCFYFTTNTSSKKIAQFKNNPKASIYFADRRFFRGVLLLGTAEILQDAETKERIWRSGDELYYPKGVTDADYCVIRFTAEIGKYYSDFSVQQFTVDQEMC